MLGRGLAVAAIAVALDQASKAMALAHFGETGCAPHRAVVNSLPDQPLTLTTGTDSQTLNLGPVPTTGSDSRAATVASRSGSRRPARS